MRVRKVVLVLLTAALWGAAPGGTPPGWAGSAEGLSPVSSPADENTSVIPAPSDPTRLPIAQGWRTETLVDGLEHPWGLAFLPGGDLLITERPGRLRRVRDGVLLPDPIAGAPAVLALRQGGLLDVAADPDFARNRFIYLSFASGSESVNATRVVRGRLQDNQLLDVTQIFEATPQKAGGFHFGSRLVFLPDGTLLISVGDGGSERNRAQDLGAHFGKVARIRPDGATASDNPFHARADARAEVWSYGHRNIQGMARDPVSGRIYATEHGAQGGDELNLLTPGSNYGWPLATSAVEYGPDKRPISPHRSLPEMTDPLVVWTPSIAPSGLTVYRGDLFRAWNGDLFAGAMVTGSRAIAGGVVRIDLDDNGRVQGQERLAIDARVRDVRTGPDGALYVLTDEVKGRLIRITPTP
jgi:glucose/arabinose dehydrogenase